MKQDLIAAAGDIFSALLFCAAIFFVYCFVQMVEDHSAENEQAKQAIEEQRKQERFEHAAQEACGPNASWKLTENENEIICLTKKGKAAGRAAL